MDSAAVPSEGARRLAAAPGTLRAKGKACGISYTAIWFHVSGRCVPRVDVLLVYQRVFGIDPATWLAAGDVAHEPEEAAPIASGRRLGPRGFAVTRIRDGRTVRLRESSQDAAEATGARWLGCSVDGVIAYRDLEPDLAEE